MEIQYGEFLAGIKELIRKFARQNDIDDYEDEDADFGFIEGLMLASDITFSLYCQQDESGIKIVADFVAEAQRDHLD